MATIGVGILKILQGADLKELNPSLTAYLAPLFRVSGSDAQHSAENELRKLAKEYAPVLVQLLKTCGTKLASLPSRDDAVANGMADEIFSAMGTALDALGTLRSQLTGSFFEMELQRYGLVRRLMAWKRYGAALSQSQVLFESLCRLTTFKDLQETSANQSTSGRTSKSKGGTVKMKSSAVKPVPCDGSVLCPPRDADLGSGLPALVVAAAVDLIWCIAERSEDCLSYHKMAVGLPDQLTPWISVLDPGTASKHRDALFRAVCKLSLIMVEDPTKYDPNVIQQFCIITLSLCASSTQGDQYAKLARKLFSTLSSPGSDWRIKSVEICISVFSEVLSNTKVRGIWASYDFVELVEWFARCCQSSCQVEHGWFYIYKLVHHIKPVFPRAPVVITGLYAVGLVLMRADAPETRLKESRVDSFELADLKKLERLSKDPEFFSKACFLLQSAEEVLKLWFQQGRGPSVQTNSSLLAGGHTRNGSSERGSTEVVGRTLVCAARALHFVQKSFTRYVQIVWNACSGSFSTEELPHSLFNCALQKMLQLFCPVLEEGMRCSDLSDNEKDIFKKGYQMAVQASLAALRLSLLLNDDVQGNVAFIGGMIHNLQREEKSWLMSSAYNMGVQLFNIKQYILACWPLDLAHKAAWANVNCGPSNKEAGEPTNEMISEACAKCLALVDARNRNGDPGQARLIMIDGLAQWARAHSKFHRIKCPHSLVRSFVKLTCVQNQPTVSNSAETDVRSLYTYIRDIQPPLQAGTIGLLLEEEYRECQEMEEQFTDTCHKMKEQIVEILLKKLYTGPDFVLERSRVLMRKCYDSRMQGAENLPSCVEFISEAVAFMEAAVEDKIEGTSRQISGLEQQLAVAYSIKGICSYAADHYCQEFLPNVVLSLNMWRCVLDSDVVRGGLSEHASTTAINEEESLVLLLYISELLSIQGYSVLLHEAQMVILKMIRNSKQSNAEKAWVEFWMRGRAGHVLCSVPFPVGLFSTIRKTSNAAGSSEEFWKAYFDLFPGSLLEAHWYSIQDFLDLSGEAIGGGRSTIQKPDAIGHLKNLIFGRLSNGEKSTLFTLQTAGLYQFIAELSFVDGDTHEAIKNAKEAFQIRSRLFKYVFRNSGKSASGVTGSITSNTQDTGNPNLLQVREGARSSSTWSWPFSVGLQHCLSHPSHWRILGDYIESLMQLGVINEQMGAVDEAEILFREGHRLAKEQNLPWALASFSSCLGEVHRKRHLWESAERYFIEAEHVFDDFQTGRCCESCILLGKALLEMRSGDLCRHYWCCQQGRMKESASHSNASQSNTMEAYLGRSLTSSLSHYTAALTRLSWIVEKPGQNPRPYPFESLGCSLSIEDWPTCKWTQFGRKLLSRVLLQKGKCHAHLGQLDDAVQIFEKALSVLNILGLSQSEKIAARRSLFPVEEGALLYHLSTLYLYREQHHGESRDDGRSRRKSDYLEKGWFQNIKWLYRAFSLCCQVPLLLHKIAKLLAILHVPASWVGPSSVHQGSVSTDDMAEVAAYFHQVSLGTAVRQQHLAVLDSKLVLDGSLEDRKHIRPSLSKSCLEKMQRALRIDPVNLESVGKQAREFWDCLPSSMVCCISFVSAEDVSMLKGNYLGSLGCSDAVADWLLVTRWSVASKPVVVLLPAPPLLGNLTHVGRSKSSESSGTPYDLSDDEDDDCKNHNEEPQTTPPELLSRLHNNIHSVLQRVAAEFISVLEDSRLSTSGTQPVTTLEEKNIWWKWRMELDTRLSLLLRTIEDSWLGPFKCLLLGEPKQASVSKSFELCAVYLHRMMSSMITQEQSNHIDQGFVKILLQAVSCLRAPELEKVIANMLGVPDYESCEINSIECGADCNACRWKKNEAEKYEQIKQVIKFFRAAYLLSTKACESDELKLLNESNGKRRSRRLAKGKAGSKSENPLETALQMVSDGSCSLDADLQRQPLQLILDSDAQALPWESLPALRDHEIYRMPSLGTMHAVYIQHQPDNCTDRLRAECDTLSDRLRDLDIHEMKARKTEEKKVKASKRSSIHAAKELASDKPLSVTCVNPYNTYYILNPNGDLPKTQAAFEDWFAKQLRWNGKAGTVPTAEEYQTGLQKHDLFVYLGHGSGDQYLPERYVRRLDHCAASLLMGCSSGRLSLRGEYQPVGVVLSYLMAGCPAVVANLWDVTDGDIDRFSRSLLHSWLGSQPEKESSGSAKGIRDSSDCELAMREGQHDDIAFRARCTSKFNSVIFEQTHLDSISEDIHRIGSTIGHSRNACRLPHLIGASPVCYGVPTGVLKQVPFSVQTRATFLVTDTGALN